MKQRPTLTILTTTYNRVGLLPNLYNSLCGQNSLDFEWLVIDDGSVDDTELYIKSLNDAPFDIRYYYKNNGGKCKAINFVHDKIRGDYVFIVDSDDTITFDAVSTIIADWSLYKNQREIAVISYMKIGVDGKYISEDGCAIDYYINNDISYRVNGRVKGDRAETIRTKVLQNYLFPEFVDENFMSEGWLWNNLAKDYRTVYRMYPVYVCKYLEGGLTKSGRALRMSCPYGMMENCKSFFQRETCIRVKMKELLLYCVYALCSDLSFKEKITSSNHPIKTLIMMPFGFLLYICWRFKYSED